MTGLPWEQDPTFFERSRKNQNHHFVPQGAILKRFLEPAEWKGVENRENHLRELDVGNGSVRWVGPSKAASRENLNFSGTLSTERYWTGDDDAMSEGAVALVEGKTEMAFLMVPGLAVLPLRHPRWLLAGERREEDPDGPVDLGLRRKSSVMSADRVKRDWVTAMERNRVSVVVEVLPEELDARLVLPDVAVEVRTSSGVSVDRAPWLWPVEWFPDGDAEPAGFEALTLSAPISSRVHLTITAGAPSGRPGAVDLRSVDEARVRRLNERSAERAERNIWAGRERDLRALPPEALGRGGSSATPTDDVL